MNFFRDLKVAMKELPYLPLVNTRNKNDKGGVWPDDMYRPNLKPLTAMGHQIKFALIGSDNSLDLENIFKVNDYPLTHTSNDVNWFFINGILTDRQVAINNGKALNVVFRKPITILHNPTRGFIEDMLECIFGRTFDHYVKITTSIYGYLRPILERGDKIVLLGHSQGGIIVSNILKLIKDDAIILTEGQIEVYTLAGAQDEFPNVPGVYCEHFANEKDYVARIGVMTYANKIDGSIYVRKNATGHLLNLDYLEGLSRGDYCNGQSRLHSYSYDCTIK